MYDLDPNTLELYIEQQDQDRWEVSYQHSVKILILWREIV
jgi:hypothetical protein